MTRPVDMSKFIKTLDKIKIPSTVSKGFHDPDTWVDTGNYLLNYLVSGDYFKGVPLGKVTVFAGDSGSGKSLVVSGNIARNAQLQGILPVIFDSENALDDDWLQALGVDTAPGKLMKFNVSLINDVAAIMNNFIKSYRETSPEERPKMLFIIDSLGMMTTPVEQAQFEAGNMKGDMGHKPKQLASLVRNLVVQIADLNIGVVCTNHTYASQDMFDPDDKVSGGQGFIYASSIVVATKKLKLKENEEGQKVSEVEGVKAACKIMKSRYGKAFETCKLNIRFDKGLEPYSGLFDYLERLGVLVKVGNRYKYDCRDGTEILEFRKNYNEEHFHKIMTEWDYAKYKLKSDKRIADVEHSEEELQKLEEEFLTDDSYDSDEE
jgi:RecA/RadA recombinase